MKLFQACGEGPGKRVESHRVCLIRTVKAHGFTLGARQQVHMIVHDRLSGGCSVDLHDCHPVRREFRPDSGGNAFGNDRNRLHGRLRDIEYGFIMMLRDHQCMPFGSGKNVHEGQYQIRFQYFVAGPGPGDDATKYAVGFGSHIHGLRGLRLTRRAPGQQHRAGVGCAGGIEHVGPNPGPRYAGDGGGGMAPAYDGIVPA